MTSARERLRAMQSKLNVTAKKSLGQNFLISDHVIEKIIRGATRFQPKTILEIGPGLGALTEGLKAICERLVLLELDTAFSEHWRAEKYEVIEVDALQWSWDLSEFPQPIALVSNLPYQISASLVVDRSLDAKPLSGMVLMFQKEVAQRIRARPETSEYGFLSVISQTFWDIEMLLEAGPRDFSPSPKIASRVLVFNPRQVQISNRKSYLQFLKACFLHPRKLMASNLVEGLGKEKAFFEQALQATGLSIQIRAQQVHLAQFLELYNRIQGAENG